MEMKLVPNLIKIVYVKLLHSSFNKAFLKITALIFRINYGIVIIAKIITYWESEAGDSYRCQTWKMGSNIFKNIE